MQKDGFEPSDIEIVQDVLGGNVNAFELLLKRHQGLVLRIARRHLPQAEVAETVQEIFVRAYRSLPNFKGTGAFSHWLSAIAVRTCYDYWRRAYRTREIPLSDLTDGHQQWLESVMSEETLEGSAGMGYRSEAVEILDWAMGRLSAEDRMVLELVYFEGHTVKETARQLGWSVANVKVRSFRARRKLEKILRSLISKQGQGGDP